MTAAKATNYTAEQTAEMVSTYKAAPTAETVESLAANMGKSVRSVIAKLSTLGVYIKAESKTKSAETGNNKVDLASAIGAVLRMDKADSDSLIKASKKALETIFKALAESKPI